MQLTNGYLTCGWGVFTLSWLVFAILVLWRHFHNKNKARGLNARIAGRQRDLHNRRWYGSPGQRHGKVKQAEDLVKRFGGTVHRPKPPDTSWGGVPHGGGGGRPEKHWVGWGAATQGNKLVSWRTLVGVHNVTQTHVFVVVPAWNTKLVVPILLDTLPALTAQRILNGAAFLHAKVNLGADRADELTFTEWEND